MTSMTREEIETTDWARRFRDECPTSYAEAINLAVQLAEDNGFVIIEKRDDHSSQSDYLWAVIPECNSDFWLEALPTKRASLEVCRAMKWRVRR